MTALVTGNLPLLSSAPNGIKRLKGLVVDLAIRGLLTRSHECIAPTKVEAAQQHGAQWPFSIPAHWRWCQLSDLDPSFQNGASSRGEAEGVPATVIRLADIKGGEICLDDPRTLTLAHSTVEKYELSVGDVLVIRVNGSADLVGRLIVCRNGPQAIPCDHFIRMRFQAGLVDAAYLKIVGDSSSSRSAIAGLFVSTAGQKTVNQGHIGSLRVPLPPIEEQARIVAKVDELMALCDRLEAEQADAEAAHAKLVEALLASLTQARDAADFRASWQQLAGHFHTLFTTEASVDALKQTVLRLAVMGRLVPQDMNDEPASELLKKVSAEGLTSAKGEKRKRNDISQRDNADQPFQLPAGWEWSRVDDLVSIKHGYAFSSSHFIEHSGPFVLTTPGNFYEVGGFRDRGARTKYYDGPTPTEFIFCPGDLIIAMTEQAAGLLGSAAFIPSDGKTYLHNQRLGKLIFNPEHLAPQYLYYFFNCPLLRASVAASSTGMKVKHTSPDKVGRVPLPIPPLREQHRIAAKVGELFALCDQLKLDIEVARQRQEHLASVLVEQAVA